MPHCRFLVVDTHNIYWLQIHQVLFCLLELLILQNDTIQAHLYNQLIESLWIHMFQQIHRFVDEWCLENNFVRGTSIYGRFFFFEMPLAPFYTIGAGRVASPVHRSTTQSRPCQTFPTVQSSEIERSCIMVELTLFLSNKFIVFPQKCNN